jgi:PHD-finger
VLCDGCPRAYHLACMRGVGWGDLPAGEWHCPRCAERRGAALRKLAEFEARKHEALERWACLVLPPAVLLMSCWC